GGLIGGGMAVAGGVVLARSIARSLMGAKIDKDASSETVAEKQAEEMRRLIDIEKEKQAIHEQLLDLIDERTTVYRKRNQRRLLAGTAIAAAAGLVGASAS